MSPTLKGKRKNQFKVRPITNPAKIREIRSNLKSNPRDLMLFDLITQTGIELNCLLGLKVSDLLPLKIGDRLAIPELQGKTPDMLLMTRTLYATWRLYLETYHPDADWYIIRSRKKSGALHFTTASDMVRHWLESVNLYGLGGVRSLRKTWEFYSGTSGLSSHKKVAKKKKKQEVLYNAEQTVQNNVYSRLFYDIVSGRIRPGARLVAHGIAKQMHVSQAPVREALRLLQAAGLVSPPHKTGSLVNKLSVEDLKEISELRILLEILAVRKAFYLIDQEALIKLERLHQKYVEYVNLNAIEQALEINLRFHHTVYAAANKPVLLSIIRGLWDRMSPYLHLLFKAVSTYNLRSTIDNHQNILDGLKRKNEKMVVRALETDLETARNNILHFLAEND